MVGGDCICREDLGSFRWNPLDATHNAIWSLITAYRIVM